MQEIDESFTVEEDLDVSHISANDPEFFPKNIDEDVEVSTKKATNLALSLDNSSVKFHIKRKCIEDLVEGTKGYFQRKYKQAKAALKQQFAEAASPCQSQQFVSSILDGSSSEADDKRIPDDPSYYLHMDIVMQ